MYSQCLILPSFPFGSWQDSEEKILEPPSTNTAQGVLLQLIATPVNHHWQVKVLMKDKLAMPEKIIQVWFFVLVHSNCWLLVSSTILSRWNSSSPPTVSTDVSVSSTLSFMHDHWPPSQHTRATRFWHIQRSWLKASCLTWELSIDSWARVCTHFPP